MNYYTSSPESTSSGSYFAEGPSFSSRLESASPLLSAYPALAKLRHDASRGFDPEDDHEFCPALVAYPSPANQFGMYTPGLLAPQSPQQPAPQHASATASAPASDGIPTLVPRTRQTVEIVDPATGLRVQRR